MEVRTSPVLLPRHRSVLRPASPQSTASPLPWAVWPLPAPDPMPSAEAPEPSFHFQFFHPFAPSILSQFEYRQHRRYCSDILLTTDDEAARALLGRTPRLEVDFSKVTHGLRP